MVVLSLAPLAARLRERDDAVPGCP